MSFLVPSLYVAHARLRRLDAGDVRAEVIRRRGPRSSLLELLDAPRACSSTPALLLDALELALAAGCCAARGAARAAVLLAAPSC